MPKSQMEKWPGTQSWVKQNQASSQSTDPSMCFSPALIPRAGMFLVHYRANPRCCALWEINGKGRALCCCCSCTTPASWTSQLFFATSCLHQAVLWQHAELTQVNTLHSTLTSGGISGLFWWAAVKYKVLQCFIPVYWCYQSWNYSYWSRALQIAWRVWSEFRWCHLVEKTAKRIIEGASVAVRTSQDFKVCFLKKTERVTYL